MSRRAGSRRDRADHAVERFELAEGVEHFGAIECQRIAHRPSEADVDAAGLFRERIRESIEEIGAGCGRPRQFSTVPVLVLLDLCAAKSFLKCSQLRLTQ